MRVLAGVPVYPLLFAATFLVTKLIESWAPVQVVVRPLLIILVVIGAAQLIAQRFAGSHRGAFLVVAVLLTLIEVPAAGLVIASAAVPLLWSSARARQLMAVDWPLLSRFLNVVAVLTLSTTIGAGLMNHAFFLAGGPPHQTAAVAAAPDAPDIYLIMLDAYPRADTLLEAFDYDNTPFLESMRGLGFDVADAAHSNYSVTPLTLASLFNAEHIGDLMPHPPAGAAAQARRLSQLINAGSALQAARALGYEVVSMPPPNGYVTLFNADRVIDAGYLTEYELSLLQHDVARRVGPGMQREFFLDQHRQRIVSEFTALRALPFEDSGRPRLVFAHVFAPHPPLAFQADGRPALLEGCTWTLCKFGSPPRPEIRAAVAAQITYVNAQVVETAKAIVERNRRPAAIVVFSDHGLRGDSSDHREMLRSLLLTYTPGKPGLFPRDASPINILPRLFDAYLDAGLPLRSEESYWLSPAGGREGFFPLEPIEP